MKDSIRRKQDKFERQDAFMVDNTADFPAGTPGNAVAVINRAVIDELNSLSATQVSRGSSAAAAIGNKDDDFDEIYSLMRNMNRAANAFDVEEPGSNLTFRLPRNRSEQNILATARAYHTDSEPLEAKFIEYGLDIKFRLDLQTLITSIEQKSAQADTSVEQRAGATGGLTNAARRGMANSRRMDAIVRIKYADNPQKLAAWTVASHLERAPKKPTPPTP